MNIRTLEQSCYDNHIELTNEKIDGTKGAFISYRGLNIINLDCDTEAERYQVLGEELGHFFTGSSYNLNCKDALFVARMEFKAKSWNYEHLISRNKLKAKLSENFYDIADYFNVTPEFLYKACEYYVEKYGEI